MYKLLLSRNSEYETESLESSGGDFIIFVLDDTSVVLDNLEKVY